MLRFFWRSVYKAFTTIARLSKKVWDNAMLTLNTDMIVYQACVLITFHFGSDSWTLYPHQERRLNVFHMRSLRRLLSITLGKIRFSNTSVLAHASMPNLFAILSQRCLRCLGHVRRKEDSPKGLPVRRARLLLTSYRTTYPALQRHLQERFEDLRESISRSRGGGLKPQSMAGKHEGGHKIS
ncbi:hypothetical protein ElyMa_001236100 [Elysia marginata]|uniref:Uncharacterized protein n=1 Tax=Elysia marginata TaxID=1093978 RepID=A0AAV4ID14_9GAST|nr:hypothetical protein ElyMa_001236100 [Elysia marginata]